MNLTARNVIRLLWLIGAGAILPSSAHAHPLGNNSVTQFNVLYPYQDRVEIEFFVTFAEIPTAEVLSEIDTNRDGTQSPAEAEKWSYDTIRKLKVEDLIVKLNGRPLALELMKQTQDDGKSADWYALSKQPGDFPGLWHVFFMARFKAPYPKDSLHETNTLTYADNAYADTFGLKRVLLDLPEDQADKIKIADKDVPLVAEEENPFAFEYYNPFDLPVERAANVKFHIAGWKPNRAAASQPASLRPAAPTPLAGVRDSNIEQRFQGPPKKPNRLARYFTRDVLTFWTLVVGTLVALVSGAAHALAPGHAKTAVAAYLISQHGSYRHAVVLAVTVTFTHVFFVILMGLVILKIGARTGEATQLWLGIISGLMIAGMGIWLFLRAVAGRIGHHHPEHQHSHDKQFPHSPSGWFRRLFSHSHPHLEAAHDHPHTHDHGHPHSHDHDHPHHADHATPQPGGPRITARQIILLGIAGGMVPCPTATLIMLAMISLNRVMLGFYVIGVFSLGLALMLMVVGTLALTSQRFAARILRDETTGRINPRSNFILTRLLPMGSGIVVAAFGALIATHYSYLLATGRPLIGWLA